MRVNDPNLTTGNTDALGGAGLERTQQAESVSRRKSGARGAGGGDSSDTVSLSNLSSQIRMQSAESPERVARLEQLGADVALGRYHVEARQLSQRLVEGAITPAS